MFADLRKAKLYAECPKCRGDLGEGQLPIKLDIISVDGKNCFVRSKDMCLFEILKINLFLHL